MTSDEFVQLVLGRMSKQDDDIARLRVRCRALEMATEGLSGQVVALLGGAKPNGRSVAALLQAEMARDEEGEE